MYSIVSVRIGISWCVQYCVIKGRDLLVYMQYRVNKDRGLMVYSTVSISIGISWCVQYCVNKDRGLLVCRVLCQ